MKSTTEYLTFKIPERMGFENITRELFDGFVVVDGFQRRCQIDQCLGPATRSIR